MKRNNKIVALLLAAAMLLTSFLLCACQGEQGGTDKNTDGGSATYEVKVLDGQGNPCTTGVIVKILRDGKQVTMQPVNADGVASKELEKGDYTVELVFTDDEASSYYDKSLAVLSAEKTSIEISLMNSVSGDGHSLFATSPVSGESKAYTAYNVGVGSTYVSVLAEDRNYFLFVPTEAGTYKFSVNNKDLAIGYYGAPHFVQSESVSEVKDNAFSISVSASSIGTEGGGTATYVIGIDGAEKDCDCVLSIERTGDAEYSISDEPWTEYKTTHQIAPFTLDIPEGKKLTYIDIMGETADAEIVYNENDGYYHLGTADGPVIYINLGKTAPFVSLQKVIMGDGLAGGAPIRSYFFDENGDFVKKEDYTAILTKYFENMDQNSYVYPLNDDLIYIIKNGCGGWWDVSSPDYIFDGCNPEIGWMFACCYLK